MSTGAFPSTTVSNETTPVAATNRRSIMPHRYQDATESNLGDWATVTLPQEVEEALARIAGLPADWDGHGTVAVDPATIERTEYVLRVAFLFGGGHLPAPFIGPAYDGRMILEWDDETGKELIVDVPASLDARIRFLLVEPDLEGAETEIEAEISDRWSIQGIMRRLLGNRVTARYTGQDATDGLNQANGS